MALLRHSAPAVLLAAAVVSTPALAANESVGAISAVNQSAVGRPPGSAARALTIGAPIAHRETIQTNAAGTAQIVFTDQSTMNVGRGSTVVVDRYVYDPSARRGEQAVSLTKGMLRFVGGQVSHGAGMSVRTPVATVGVRGGIGTIGFLSGCGVLVLNQYGAIAVRNDSGGRSIRRPGYYVCVGSRNEPIGEPRMIDPEMLARVMALLTSGPGQTGGALQPFSNGLAGQFGYGGSRLPDQIGPPEGTPGLDSLGPARAGNAIVQSGSQGNNFDPTEPTTGGNCTSIICN